MFTKSVAIFILLLSACNCAMAQSSALWRDNTNTHWNSATTGTEAYYWNNWSDRTYPKGIGNYICESNGTPLLHNGQVNLIKAIDGTKVASSDSLVPLVFSEGWFQRNDTVYDLIGYYDSSLYEDYKNIYTQYSWYGGNTFDLLSDYPSGIYRHTVTKTNKGWVCTEKNQRILTAGKPFIDVDGVSSPIIFNITSSNRYTDYDYVIPIVLANDDRMGINLYKLSNGELYPLDSLIFGSSAPYFKEPILVPPNIRKYSSISASYQDVIVNRSHSKMYFVGNGTIRIDTFNKSIIIGRYTALFEVDIDPETLQFENVPQAVWEFQENIDPFTDNNQENYREYISGLEVSPNDSILYFDLFSENADSSNGELERSYESKLCYWSYLKEDFNPVTLITEISKIKLVHMSPSELNPFGKIHFLVENESFIVENTNTPYTVDSKLKVISVGGSDPGLRNYDYVRLKPNISYSCDAQVRIENNSDLSRGMKHFTWYFTKEDGSSDTLSCFEPVVNYNENGAYPFKCYGYSPEGIGYGEIYIDTIHIEIPTKPVASFEVSDTIVCAYSSIQFSSNSFADSFNQESDAQLVWTFGDGETETMKTVDGSGQVAHVYSSPGVYTVSLFFSNGFCDSTLVKNQYIKVVDAPKPGFSIDNIQGCTPFTVNITDTNTSNIVRKEYYYSDLNEWLDVTTPEFQHTFYKPGSYYIVQKLYGFTGCITQEDTVYIQVSPGFEETDSVHVINATYVNTLLNFKSEPTVIELSWTPLEGVKEYLVYQQPIGFNRTLIARTENEYWLDTLNEPGDLTYTIEAKDSCGNISSFGRVGRPIFLQGEVVGKNRAAVLNYNAYEDWGTTTISFTASRIEDGTEIDFNVSPSAESIEDIGFAEGNGIERCYRISANGSGQKSYSNILCLPYNAIVFIPNAFSPNNDGLNDVFNPTTFGIESYTLKIYNRWGEEVFRGTNEGWKGESAMQGNYTYLIQLTTVEGEIIYKNGVITLLK